MSRAGRYRQEEDRERIAGRKTQVEAHCRQVAPNPKYPDSRIPIISLQNHFLFCPVAKSASTFWSRFVLQLNASGVMESPYKLPPLKMPLLTETKLSAIDSREDRVRFLRESLKTVFVRDPYHRMFSAYVDKAFAPNPVFWLEWGWRRPRKFALQFRTRKRCFHDLTLAEAVSYTHLTLPTKLSV